MVKVSIIVPVYNSEKYLSKCLDSLCNQTLLDIEIICVNDFSDDDSLDILKKYAQNDKRIKIIDLPSNLGPAKARNIGIKEANGQYIGFVDSDDFVDLNFYEKLYDKAIAENENFVLGNMKYLNIETNQVSISDFLKKINENNLNFYLNFTTAIYKKDFLKTNDIKFTEESLLGEDRALPIKAAILNKLQNKKISVVGDVFYVYVRVRNSVTNSKLTSEKINGLAFCWVDIIKYLNSLKISQEDYVYIVENLMYGYIMFFVNAPYNLFDVVINGFFAIYDNLSVHVKKDKKYLTLIELIEKKEFENIKKCSMYMLLECNRAKLIK